MSQTIQRSSKIYKKLSILAGLIILIGLAAVGLGLIEWRDSGEKNALTIIGVAVTTIGAVGMLGVVIVEWYNKN